MRFPCNLHDSDIFGVSGFSKVCFGEGENHKNYSEEKIFPKNEVAFFL